MSHRYRLPLALLAILGCHGWRRSEGDDGFDMRALVAECPRNARILAGGYAITQPEKDSVRDAYDNIRFCDDAVTALASAWRNPPTDTVTLEILAARSGYHDDRRFLEIVLPIATDTSRSRPLRWSAMETLLELYDPTLRIGSLSSSGPQSRWMGVVDHPTQEKGDQPLTPADRARILEAFTRMATSDPDERIRRMSNVIARHLARGHR